MYGGAVLDACEQIKARMEPIASRHNFASFAEVCLYLQFLFLSLLSDPLRINEQKTKLINCITEVSFFIINFREMLKSALMALIKRIKIERVTLTLHWKT